MIAATGIGAPHWHPDVWLFVALLGGGYLMALRRLGPTLAPAGGPVATRGQVRCFTIGLVLLWVFSDWPVHELSEERLLSVHMVQHLVYTLGAPGLLLLGTPTWLARWLLPGRLLTVVRALARPIVAGVIFNVVQVVSHLPGVVDVTLRSELAHFFAHAVLVVTALIMWLPVASPLPEIRRLPPFGQMVYLFLQSVIPTVPASFLTFAEAPLYRFYAEAPRIWGITVLDDQQTAGAVMKVFGGLVLWSAIIAVFFRWYGQEHRDRHPDRLTMADVERGFAKGPAPVEPAPPAAPPATPSSPTG